MFSTIDKAIVALIMSSGFLLTNLAGVDLGIGEDMVNLVLGAATPLLVYLWPNKPWA